LHLIPLSFRTMKTGCRTEWLKIEGPRMTTQLHSVQGANFFSQICVSLYWIEEFKHTNNVFLLSAERGRPKPAVTGPSNRPLVSILHKWKQPKPTQPCDLGGGLVPSTQRYDHGGGLVPSRPPRQALSIVRKERVQCFGIGRSQVAIEDLVKVLQLWCGWHWYALKTSTLLVYQTLL
jgi:hypothetical protein